MWGELIRRWWRYPLIAGSVIVVSVGLLLIVGTDVSRQGVVAVQAARLSAGGSFVFTTRDETTDMATPTWRERRDLAELIADRRVSTAVLNNVSVVDGNESRDVAIVVWGRRPGGVDDWLPRCEEDICLFPGPLSRPGDIHELEDRFHVRSSATPHEGQGWFDPHSGVIDVTDRAIVIANPDTLFLLDRAQIGDALFRLNVIDGKIDTVRRVLDIAQRSGVAAVPDDLSWNGRSAALSMLSLAVVYLLAVACLCAISLSALLSYARAQRGEIDRAAIVHVECGGDETYVRRACAMFLYGGPTVLPLIAGATTAVVAWGYVPWGVYAVGGGAVCVVIAYVAARRGVERKRRRRGGPRD